MQFLQINNKLINSDHNHGIYQPYIVQLLQHESSQSSTRLPNSSVHFTVHISLESDNFITSTPSP